MGGEGCLRGAGCRWGCSMQGAAPLHSHRSNSTPLTHAAPICYANLSLQVVRELLRAHADEWQDDEEAWAFLRDRLALPVSFGSGLACCGWC